MYLVYYLPILSDMAEVASTILPWNTAGAYKIHSPILNKFIKI